MRLRHTIKSLRRFAGAQSGIAAVELSLLSPVLFGALGLLVFAGQAYEIQRRVELTAGTITNLVAAAPIAQNVTNANVGAGATYINQSSIDTDIALAAVTMYPLNTTQLTVIMSELSVNPLNNIGQVYWSEASTGATPLPFLSTVALNPVMAQAGVPFVIYGKVSYTYQPLGLFSVIGPITFHANQFLAPRNSLNIEVNWGL